MKENQIVKALPKMANAASHDQLKAAFTEHLEQTKGHVGRLETMFKSLGGSPKGKKCKAMEGLIEEGEEMVKAKAVPSVHDAGLIAAAQRVEHYEIAGYGTVRTLADQLGHAEIARILQETLDEEGACDKKLTQIAESRVNVKAAAKG